MAMAEKAKRLGVDIRMNTAVTPELIEEINPHTVINAIGAVPIIPDIPERIKILSWIPTMCLTET